MQIGTFTAVLHLHYLKVVSILHFKGHPCSSRRYRYITRVKRFLCYLFFHLLGTVPVAKTAAGWLVPIISHRLLPRAQEGHAHCTRMPGAHTGSSGRWWSVDLESWLWLQLSSYHRIRANLSSFLSTSFLLSKKKSYSKWMLKFLLPQSCLSSVGSLNVQNLCCENSGERNIDSLKKQFLKVLMTRALWKNALAGETPGSKSLVYRLLEMRRRKLLGSKTVTHEPALREPPNWKRVSTGNRKASALEDEFIFISA